jgi:hypothetical protein
VVRETKCAVPDTGLSSYSFAIGHYSAVKCRGKNQIAERFPGLGAEARPADCAECAAGAVIWALPDGQKTAPKTGKDGTPFLK